MLDVLEQLEANICLISYRQGDKFKVIHEQINNHLNTTTVFVRESSPKIFRALALLLIFIYGFIHVKKKDIIFAHAPYISTGFMAFLLAKMFNKPLVVDHIDVRAPTTPKFIFNSVLRNSIVFAISRYLEREVEEIGCRKVVYIPIFIDTDVFQEDFLERVKIREKLGIDFKDIVIGYAGSFWYVEGVPFLLKAFRNLVRRHENIKLIVIGGMNVPGSDNVALLIEELAIKEKVIIIPQQPHEFIPKYLSACDIACSPKIDCEINRAANPIKIYEYMSMGLITIISAVGEVSNVIENGVNGFLVKPGDEDNLEITLEYIIQNIDSMEEVGKQAREVVIKNYSQRAASRRIGEILQQEFLKFEKEDKDVQ